MRKARAIGLILSALFAVAICSTLLSSFCQCVGLTLFFNQMRDIQVYTNQADIDLEF